MKRRHSRHQAATVHPNATVEYALSLRQPWAALLVHGLKSIEVRSWPTARRGRVHIHAARLPDDRAAAWDQVPAELRVQTELRGGIVGVGMLTHCRRYLSVEAFAADQAKHLNDPEWFCPPVLYGFEFKNLRPMPFRRCRGQTRMFVLMPVGTSGG